MIFLSKHCPKPPNMKTFDHGVNQGGVLSPHLFNVNMNGLSDILNRVNIGCMINNVRFNHLMYADDTVLISPSARDLQRLILLC